MLEAYAGAEVNFPLHVLILEQIDYTAHFRMHVLSGLKVHSIR